METTRYNIFGWKIDRSTLKSGEVFQGVIPEDVSRDRIINNTLYTRGIITAKSSIDGLEVKTRYPGFYNSDMPEIIKAQTIIFTVEEDAEFWCLNYVVNGRKQPNLSVLKLKAGESTTLPAYLKVLICRGSLKINSVNLSETNSVELSSDAEVSTTEETYCLLIS